MPHCHCEGEARSNLTKITKSKTITYVFPTTTIEGAVTNISSGRVATVAGKEYSLFGNKDFNEIAVNKNKVQTLVLDSFGYVIASKDAVAQYAFVVKVGTGYVTSGSLLKQKQIATLLFTDGEMKDVVIQDNDARALVNEVVTYTVNEKDVYEINNDVPCLQINATSQTEPMFGGNADYRANANTVYFVVDYDEDGELVGTATKYVGYKDAPEYTGLGDGGAAAAFDKPTADGVVDYVFINNADATAVSSGKYVYVKGTYNKTAQGKFAYDVIIAGEDDTIVLPSTENTVDPNTLYAVISTSGEGTYTKAVTALNGTGRFGTYIENKAGLLYVDEAYVDTVKGTTPVYTFNTEDDSCVTSTAKDLGKVVPNKGNVYVEENTAGDVVAIYIIVRGDDESKEYETFEVSFDSSSSINFNGETVKVAGQSVTSKTQTVTVNKGEISVVVTRSNGLSAKTYTLKVNGVGQEGTPNNGTIDGYSMTTTPQTLTFTFEVTGDAELTLNEN